jgi:hypothetical protein
MCEERPFQDSGDVFSHPEFDLITRVLVDAEKNNRGRGHDEFWPEEFQSIVISQDDEVRFELLILLPGEVCLLLIEGFRLAFRVHLETDQVVPFAKGSLETLQVTCLPFITGVVTFNDQDGLFGGKDVGGKKQKREAAQASFHGLTFRVFPSKIHYDK